MSDIDVTAAMADRGRDLRIQGQIIPPAGTTAGQVLTATSVGGLLGSSWQAGASASAITQLFDQLLAGSQANFDANPIPTTSFHLLIIVSGRGDVAANNTNLQIRFNNDSGGNYQQQNLQSQNTTVTGSAQDNQTQASIGDIPGATAAANYSGCAITFVPAYSQTSLFKPFYSSETLAITTGLGGLLNGVNARQWRSQAAINRVTVFPGSGNFVAGSRCTIYGLA